MMTRGKECNTECGGVKSAKKRRWGWGERVYVDRVK